ncbi:hypothetical protein RRG08_016097 [Elysia crispata]|uniref:Uncharacterized protein n=1 Tax=Elysia crispata TaxID=231223 RepID=A0AAE0ZPJ4_9GAST|nr:hypothetical protein RRG08_016097 [Elysia crispata]
MLSNNFDGPCSSSQTCRQTILMVRSALHKHVVQQLSWSVQLLTNMLPTTFMVRAALHKHAVQQLSWAVQLFTNMLSNNFHGPCSSSQTCCPTTFMVRAAIHKHVVQELSWSVQLFTNMLSNNFHGPCSSSETCCPTTFMVRAALHKYVVDQLYGPCILLETCCPTIFSLQSLRNLSRAINSPQLKESCMVNRAAKRDMWKLEQRRYILHCEILNAKLGFVEWDARCLGKLRVRNSTVLWRVQLFGCPCVPVEGVLASHVCFPVGIWCGSQDEFSSRMDRPAWFRWFYYLEPRRENNNYTLVFISMLQPHWTRALGLLERACLAVVASSGASRTERGMAAWPRSGAHQAVVVVPGSGTLGSTSCAPNQHHQQQQLALRGCQGDKVLFSTHLHAFLSWRLVQRAQCPVFLVSGFKS